MKEIDTEFINKKLGDGQRIPGIWAVFNMVGGVSGLLALLTVAMLGGELKRQVMVNTKRLEVIEMTGSPSVQAHIKALFAEVDARRESDNLIAKRLDDTRADFNQRMNNITLLFEKVLEQSNQLITLIKVQQQTGRP